MEEAWEPSIFESVSLDRIIESPEGLQVSAGGIRLPKPPPGETVGTWASGTDKAMGLDPEQQLFFIEKSISNAWSSAWGWTRSQLRAEGST